MKLSRRAKNQERPTPKSAAKGRLAVGCSAWLGRCGGELPKSSHLVASGGVSAAFEQVRIYVEVIPREIINVVGKPLAHIAEGRRAMNNALGYKSLHDAIINAERVRAAIGGDVIAKNLLLVFGETVEALNMSR